MSENPTNQAQMTPNEAKASLGVATQLMGNLMPQASQEQSVEAPRTEEESRETTPEQKPQDNPQEEKGDDVGSKITEFELNITKQLNEMRKEIKDDQLREIGSIKEDIKQALLDEDNEENKTKKTSK